MGRSDIYVALYLSSFSILLWGPEVGLSGQSGPKVPTGLQKSSRPNYTWGTLGISNCGGPISRFSFGRWGSFLCAHWSPWSTFLLIQYHKATVWMSQMLLFQSSFKLQCGLYAVFSWVSDCTRASLTLSGERYIEQGPGLYFHKYGTHSFNWTKYKS